MFNWKLEELYPRHAELLDTLDKWFSDPASSFHRGYHCGNAYHPGQIQKFYARQNRDGSKWMVRTAKRLFAVRRAVIKKSKYLLEAGLPDSETWLLRNCRPSGGKWVPVGPRNGFTGSQCGSVLCPWCWMRRFETLKRILTTPEDQDVKTHRGKTTKGLGLQVVHVKRYLIDSFEVFIHRDLLKQAIEQVRQTAAKEGAGLGKGLKLVGLVHNEGTRLQISYLMGKPWVYGKTIEYKPFGKVISDTVAGFSIESALHAAQPYPLHLLSGKPETAVQICRGLRRIRSFNRLTL
jgi:hypothetical protein